VSLLDGGVQIGLLGCRAAIVLFDREQAGVLQGGEPVANASKVVFVGGERHELLYTLLAH